VIVFVDYVGRPRGFRRGLAAIHSLFRFAALRHPEHAEMITRVLAIPPKRYDRTQVAYLNRAEVAALLGAPDRTTWTGRRDHAWVLLAVTTGLRVSELTALTRGDLNLDTGPHVHCHGKGRKDRTTPLTAETVAVLRTWTNQLPGHHRQARPAAHPRPSTKPASRYETILIDIVRRWIEAYARWHWRTVSGSPNSVWTPELNATWSGGREARSPRPTERIRESSRSTTSAWRSGHGGWALGT